MKINFLAIVMLCAALSSCDSKGSEKSSSDTSVVVPAAEETAGEESKKPLELTSIEFLEKEHDFGTINEGEKAIHVFKFKNTGSNPLVISDARPGCGCTVPTFTKDPVAPGETGEIKVEFDSNGKSGQSTKKVTVISNTEPGSNEISFKVNVLKKIDGPYKQQQ
ncbi:MAG: DUF1573 domain-containing protein [Cytophagaceae bacterium]|jgi:hypothetical protein|nr:DUF1573 domain-containing protein [Cytophagaceae bacterium]